MTLGKKPLDSASISELTHSALYAAISVQQGSKATESSELESVFYMLTRLSSAEDTLHWQRSPAADADRKVAAMMNSRIFQEKVRISGNLCPCSLHDVGPIPLL